MTDKPKLRWYQYSLRSLFVLMTLVACACSWYAYEMNEAAKRRAAIEKIIEAGGKVLYYDASNPNSGEPPAWYAWLRKLHGDEHLGNAIAVGEGPWTKLERLHLDRTQITDAGLVHLRGLTKLEVLNLSRSPSIDGSGLVHLKDLTNLKVLYLASTQITDAGIMHLKDLTNLEYLSLYDTQVTDEGVKKLQDALPNCKIDH
jgi:Leucine-rich repeat (LRR) protein